MQKYVKVLIAQTGSVDNVTEEYYERYKNEGLILIPEDVSAVLIKVAEPEATVVVLQEAPEEEPKVDVPPKLMDSVKSTKVELPKKPRGRQKRLII